uniref:Uncharacterized protein n=1 Tax=Rhipicephalus microplus TaxID=6941 RepID=A0A6G4ZZY9_RHIMP
MCKNITIWHYHMTMWILRQCLRTSQQQILVLSFRAQEKSFEDDKGVERFTSILNIEQPVCTHNCDKSFLCISHLKTLCLVYHQPEKLCIFKDGPIIRYTWRCWHVVSLLHK